MEINSIILKSISTDVCAPRQVATTKDGGMLISKAGVRGKTVFEYSGTSLRPSKKFQAKLVSHVGLAPLGPIYKEEIIEHEDRIETLVKEIKEIFRSINDGSTSSSAYDTAWVARIPSVEDTNKPQFPTTLDWIIRNQNGDGSWGEPSFFLLYDRLVCTLACILTLTRWNKGEDLVAKGLKFLRSRMKNLNGEETSLRTSGFEMVFPSMLHEARALGLYLPYDLPYLKEISSMREKKIKRIPVVAMHSVHTTMLYSLEALQEVVEWERILKLQSRDGSFLSSPSSTAIVYVKTGDQKCLDYLTYIVRKFVDHAPAQYPIDLFDRIWTVDTIQRLGLGHHFKREISDALDYVYRNMMKEGVSWGRDNPVADIDDTCMALRLLRMHGYPVSSDVLEHFRDDDGNFICFKGETHRGVSDMFNLYRFSQMSFPGEKILKEAKAFVEEHLRTCLKNNCVHDKWSLKKALHKEVDYALRNPWRLSLERLEAREYMNHYGEHDVWIAKTVYWMHNVNNPKYLELAKLDYNRLQTMYKREGYSIQRWWKNCGFDSSFFLLPSPEQFYFSIAATVYEPEYAACRITYTKCNYLETIIRDLFMSHESVEDLRIVCQAVEKWDHISFDYLPYQLKIVFQGMYDTFNEFATLASRAQGRDMFSYLHTIRSKQMQAYLKKREMMERKQATKSMKEYIEDAKMECGVEMRLLPAMFLMGEHLQDHLLKQLDSRSNVHHHLSTFLILFAGIKDFEREGQSDSVVSGYMKEENCTEQEALGIINGMIENAFDELIHEHLKPSRVPKCCRRLMFEHARITQFFFNKGGSHIWERSQRASCNGGGGQDLTIFFNKSTDERECFPSVSDLASL